MACKPKQTTTNECEYEAMRHTCCGAALHVSPCQREPMHGADHFNVFDLEGGVGLDEVHIAQSIRAPERLMTGAHLTDSS